MSAPRAEDTLLPARQMGHGEYKCPGCHQLAEYPIVRDVYGCDACRHCTAASPEERIAFEREIAERLAVRHQTNPEAS